MRLPRLLLVALLASAAPALAETPAPAENPVQPTAADVSVASIGKAMQFDDLFAVLSEEGIAHGKLLEADMFPGGGGPGWTAAVAAIYEGPGLRQRFDAALEAELGGDPQAIAAILDFFSSKVGQRVVSLEIEARRAFLDAAAEEAARVAADRRSVTRDPKLPLIERMITAGDLLEMNVAGSMTGNLAFMKGMAQTGAYGTAMPEDQILSDVWAQEEQIRADTSSWLYAYLGLAYDPLSEAELTAYVEFLESPAGHRLNAALFTAFDAAFDQVSHDLGRAAGLAMQGRDI